jgi:hypothetical protein
VQGEGRVSNRESDDGAKPVDYDSVLYWMGRRQNLRKVHPGSRVHGCPRCAKWRVARGEALQRTGMPGEGPSRFAHFWVDPRRQCLEIVGAASAAVKRRSPTRSACRLCLPRSSARTEKSTCRLTHRHLTVGADHTGLVLSPKVFGHSDVPSARHPRVR